MFQDIPVDVGIIYEGERIRRKDMFVELGGPDVKEKFELARVKKLEEVEDGKIV
ncbi:acetyl-CoA decarbonylase/synthase complex subunit beta, partial [Candidatus Bathyarchaeota archaeon]|nr:acetyl-CoA decarbonylase/synthase complex subunit beta [Candidatus Bathyarchaeota archaeon]